MLKTSIVWVCVCVSVWVVIKRVLQCFLNLSIVTSKICGFQVWAQKFSSIIRSKVAGKLKLKSRQNKSDLRQGKHLKIMMLQKDLSLRSNLRKFYQKNGTLGLKRWKKQVLKLPEKSFTVSLWVKYRSVFISRK